MSRESKLHHKTRSPLHTEKLFSGPEWCLIINIEIWNCDISCIRRRSNILYLNAALQLDHFVFDMILRMYLT